MTAQDGTRITWEVHLAELLTDRMLSESGLALAFLPISQAFTSDPDTWIDIRSSGLTQEDFEEHAVTKFLEMGRSAVLICDEMTSASSREVDRLKALPANIHYAFDDEAAYGFVTPSNGDLTAQDVLVGLSWISSGYPGLAVNGGGQFVEICRNSIQSSCLTRTNEKDLAMRARSLLFSAYHKSNFILWMN
jgi:cold shock CspA family protein